MVATIGGFLCGLVAGAAARYGRMCTMSAIEDAVIGGSSRGLKAWGLALAVAIVLTQTAIALELFDPVHSIYAAPALDWAAAGIGGLLFGFGMALTGTCAFGLLVRLGGGDLRALVSTLITGIAAFAFLSGILSSLRIAVMGLGVFELTSADQALLPNFLVPKLGHLATFILCGLVVWFLVSSAISDGRLLRRPRLMMSAVLLGAAVAGGWIVTGFAYENMESVRVESLSFVAPAGRLLLEVMNESLQDTGFGIASLFGILCGSFLIALVRNEIHMEAFDDAREMRRHLVGAALMGMGGVLAKGCTIGQGLTAGSVFSITSPLTVVAILIGAKIGLAVLLHEPSLAFSKLR